MFRASLTLPQPTSKITKPPATVRIMIAIVLGVAAAATASAVAPAAPTAEAEDFDYDRREIDAKCRRDIDVISPQHSSYLRLS